MKEPKNLKQKVEALTMAAGLVSETDAFAYPDWSEDEIELQVKENKKLANQLQKRAEKLAAKHGYEIEKHDYLKNQ
jgi:hypothetical protein